jgi:hypothetical protein
MEIERKSRLPDWMVRPVKRGRRELVGLICPHCGGRTLVAKSWFDSSDYNTRPCTYCFKTAWIPGRRPDAK